MLIDTDIDIGPDEAFAFALLADTLIRRLDLRPDARDAVLAELWREQVLVRAWLEREGRTDRA
jgi:hypothetical protein